MGNLFRLALLALACLVALGCAPTWTTVRQAEPNPFAGQRDGFVVLPFDYSELAIGKESEADYLARKDEKQRESFAEDKRATEELFAKALADAARERGINVEPARGAAGAFRIAPKVTFFEPGWYGGKASEIRIVLAIEGADGKALDVLRLEHRTSAGFSSGERARMLGILAGSSLADYLAARVGP
jgi:hypothetical protein